MAHSRRKKLQRNAAATGTITLATLGMTTCIDGCGVNDPVPPPPLTCKETNHGQNLIAQGSVDSLSLNVSIYNGTEGYIVDADTVYVSDVTGAVVDSLRASGQYDPVIYVAFTLDSLSVSQVRFTIKGRWNLEAGPCNFQRTFTCKIAGGHVHVSQLERMLPLDVPRDVRIELVDRAGLRVNLRAAVAGEGTPEWRATAGKLERVGRLGMTWELPPEPGYYQIELSVDRGVHGIGFDALALEVS